MQISMTVTGSLDGSLVTAVIGDNNTVVYNGTAVTPGGVKYSVYDDKKLLPHLIALDWQLLIESKILSPS